MTWIFYASLMPMLWSLGNVLDQYLAREAFQRSAFSFLIISGFFTIPIVIAIVLLRPEVLDIPPGLMFALLAGGMIGFAGAWPYLIALKKDDASNAIPMLQTVPVFVYLLGFLFLGERLGLVQIAGGLLIVSGAVAFVWNPHTGKLHLRTLLLMLSSAVIWAFYAIWIRFWAQELYWLTVTFWNYMAWVGIGFAGLLSRAAIRTDLRQLFSGGKAHIFLPLMFVQQGCATIADLFQTRALSIAPTGVQVILFNGSQPVIITLLCGLFYFWRPDIYQPVRFSRSFLLRLGCAGLIIVGLYLLLR